ncbi:MAG: glycosyl transferase [Lachnospiraceae bacterium]|nr:glycosyl transferase [Lachnospiraceae bacterium]MDD7027048.1 glycosyl transferase [Lachnospiraceae bacterium]MDY5700254.1 glycosyl transferase [Lachnospiraceae bacterium]
MIGTEILTGQGLGNQLFCYVTARCIAKELDRDFAILGGETLANNAHSSCGLYFMELDLGRKVAKEDFQHTYWEREDRLYLGNSRHDLTHGAYVAGTDPGMYKVPEDTLLMGNMQAEDYYLKYREEIRQWLKVKPEYDCYEYSQDDLCILHLRCTDYMDCPELFVKKSYWKQGMANMRKLNPNMRFMIITNDVKEANKILPDIPAFNFELAKDYSIIKNAKYLLLANSSFTYFPAFTSETVKYIIAPKYWARHNVSDGYWASEQNIYTGFHYQDRKGRIFTAEECRKELEEYKRTSKTYSRLNQQPEGLTLMKMKIECKTRYTLYQMQRIYRSVIRKLRLAGGRER